MARRAPGPLAEPLPPEGPVRLPSMRAAEVVRENYLMGGVSVERHPLELLRARLDEAGVVPAGTLPARGRALQGADDRRAPKNLDGAPIHRGEQLAVAGMVVCRQRPPTAGGLTFVTIEDETGFANLIVRPDVAKGNREGLSAGILLAVGRLEAADGVVNMHVSRLASLDGDRPIEGVPSHDYR